MIAPILRLLSCTRELGVISEFARQVDLFAWLGQPLSLCVLRWLIEARSPAARSRMAAARSRESGAGSSPLEGW